MATLSVVEPPTFEQAAEALAAAGADGRAVRIAGAGTKPWLAGAGPDTVSLRTTALDRVLTHDPGDMTATLQAGVALADAQRQFAGAGQMLALDPPLASAGGPDRATIGGIVASADSGPFAHRYGGPRDLVLGATVALADGTIARSGSTVIKNVAGYDVAKLLCGSFGTLGLVLSVNVRLHPLRDTVSARGRSDDRAALAAAAAALAHAPAELEALDVAWDGTGGALLARAAGPRAAARSERIAATLRDHRLDEIAVEAADEPWWIAQRAGQRAGRESGAAVLHLAHRPSQLGAVLEAVAAADASLVGRAALGDSHVTIAPASIPRLRERLPRGAVSVLRDCPAAARDAVADPWGTVPGPALALMCALKQRFDPQATCNPGVYVGGI